MRKVVVLMIVAALVISSAGPVFADGPVKKLGRGISNILTSPFELVMGIGDATKENGVMAGLTWGVLKGILGIATRAVVGVYETATFPIPLPADYEPILTDPEFIFEDELALFE